MGLISSSASFTRYRVKDQVPADYKEQYAKEIRRYAFHEIDENTDDERSSGWVNIMNIFDNEFSGEEFFKSGFIALSLRIDTRRVPAQIIKHHCHKAEKERKAALNKDFLSKTDRQDIRDQVKFQLLKRVIPNSRTFDMIWDLQNSQVYFSSVNEAICTEFLELFKETFDQNPELIFPYSLAQSLVPDEKKALLENVSPAYFTTPSIPQN